MNSILIGNEKMMDFLIEFKDILNDYIGDFENNECKEMSVKDLLEDIILYGNNRN